MKMIAIAIAMQQEELLDFNLNDDNTEDIVEKIDDLWHMNKTVGKLFKQQKGNYYEIGENIRNGKDIHDITKKLCTTQVEIVKIFKKLKDLEDEFKKIAKGTKYGSINKVTSVDVKAQRETDKRVYECTLCDFTRVSKGAIENHMYQDHSSSVQSVQCVIG